MSEWFALSAHPTMRFKFPMVGEEAVPGVRSFMRGEGPGDVYAPKWRGEAGTELGSFLTIGTAFGCRRSVFTELVRRGVTGIQKFEIVAPEFPWIAQYVGLAVTGRAEAISIDFGRIAYRRHPAGWFPCYRGLIVQGWEGHDVFMARGGLNDYVLATKKFVTLARERKWTNLNTTRTDRVIPSGDPPLPGGLPEPPADFDLVGDDE